MTQIVVLDPEALLAFTGTGAVIGIDLSEFDADNDFISIACPDFPLADVDLADSFVDFTSSASGDFGQGPTDSIAFDASVETWINGNSEFRFPLALLDSVQLSAITGVRFRIKANGSCTFRATAIRCVSADWVFAPLDSDTLYNRGVRPASPNGALYSPYAFPSATTEWPVLYRADEPTSSKDPMPVDLSIGVAFASGSLFAATGDSDYAFTMAEGDSLSVPDDSALDFSGSFTLEAWVKPSDMDDGPMGVITKWNDSANQRGYRMSFNTSGQIVFDWTTDGTTAQRAISQTANIEIDEWNHIVVTFQKPGSGSTVITFYHNGENAGSTSVSNQAVSATNRPLKMGAWITG